MRIQEISSTILRQMPGVNKWRHDFLCHVFHLVFAVRGRINLKNLSRYSDFNETTFHRHFSMSFDFAQFNSDCIYQLRHQERHWMAAADCSFITKSGKCTYGLDKFWSSVANSEKTGLEISAVSLIDIHSGEAYMLDVEQTPAGLSPKEDTQSDTKVPGQYGKAARRARRSRIDFYIEQLDRVRPQLARHGVSHVALDGYYTKYKVFEAFDEFEGLNLIGKLRCDSDLRYLYDATERGPALTNRRYDGKVRFDDSTNGWRRWQHEGYTENDLVIYTRVLNSVCFKRNLKVVACVDQQTGEYVLLFSTDLTLSGSQIIQYYCARFQIEFLFRDAKQFTGLEHSQTRKKEKLRFHFNLSMSSVNLARMDIKLGGTVKSLNDYQRLAYNTKIINLFMSTTGLNPEVDIYQMAERKSVYFGLIRA